MSGVTLVEFLTARLVEDEADARDLLGPDVEWPTSVEARSIQDWAKTLAARAIREVEAKRAIVRMHDGVFVWHDGEREDPQGHECRDVAEDGNTTTYFGRECGTLRHLAAVYSDHPDYDEGWRP